MDAAQTLNAAGAAHAAGNFSEAIRLCRQVLQAEPQNAQAALLWGVSEVKGGDLAAAISLLERVQAMDPTSYQAPLWQSMALKKLGNERDSFIAARKAFLLGPKDPQVLMHLAICYLDLRLLSEAEEHLRSAMAIAPDVPPIHYSLAHCLHLQGRKEEATKVMSASLDASQMPALELLKLGLFLLTQSSASGAAVCARRALDLAPPSSTTLAQAHLLLARVLLEDHQSAEAEIHLQAGMAIGTPDAQTLTMMGSAVQGLGRIDEASLWFRKSIDLQPNQGYAYFALANNKKVEESERTLVKKMEALVKGGTLPARQLSYLHYGIGKAHEDMEEYREAIESYDAANRLEYDLKFRGQTFLKELYADNFDRTMRQFSATNLSRNKGIGIPSEIPILVVGMMRSGTTLIEQVLSCHPEVGAAGEQSFWFDNCRSAMRTDGADIDGRAVKVLAERYVGLLEGIAPGMKRVTDKLPANYVSLGLIHLAFPNAKIIHMRRDPVDTCLSIYATPNRAVNEFAHNRENIVFAYRQYLRLMEHWRSVLEPGAMLEVDYEELVTDSEPAIRRIVEFCGLQWDDACLRPEDNRRTVITPSVWQVRQPIYRSSMARWRKFEPWLGAFSELLPS